MYFSDRGEAGRRLAERLQHLRGPHTLVLGLPRGGVPVAAEVAEALDAPLDVLLVRKLGLPFQPELAMGAIGEDGTRVLNEDIMRIAGVTPDELAETEAREGAILAGRAVRYRGDRDPADPRGRTVVVVDDGVATGSTARVACRMMRARGAEKVVLAVPVAPPEWVATLGEDADEFVTLGTPDDFSAIGRFYADFSQTQDDEVVACLERAAARTRASVPGTAARGAAAADRDVLVDTGQVPLAGHLTVPDAAAGLVVFAYGGGSGRHSPRNRYVADGLNRAGYGTLLVDLLTPDEEADRQRVFDIVRLAGRLTLATDWLAGQAVAAGLPLGYFASGTGTAAALVAASHTGSRIGAVVSRGGRPDLAGAWLPDVTVPTLFVVGGDDPAILHLNREAADSMGGESRLSVVPGAGHLFEEPGALRTVTDLARQWFAGHLPAPARKAAAAT